MRGMTSTLIIFIVAIVIVGLYITLGRAQVTAKRVEVQAKNKELQAQLDEIQRESIELPKLRADLPLWRKQLKLFKVVIPEKVDDDVFLGSVADQMKQQGVDLLRINMAKGTGWLSKANEAQLKSLQDMGVDVATAKQIKVAYYSINLIGNFNKVISAFENLKKYQRLYSIDEIAGPAGGGGGTVTKVVDPNITPIEITGKIFYGIPRDYLSMEELDKVFADAVAVPVARSVQSGVLNTAKKVLKGKPGEQAATSGQQAPPAAGGKDAKESKR